MGLLPSRNVIREGSVRFEGMELTTMSLRQRRNIWGAEMAMIFQDPMTSLNPVMKIGKQIAEPLRIHLDMSRSDATATALRLLEDVGIPEPEKRLGQYPHELSGGMRQRVMIAMALACGPTLLFADEPTTALDVTVQAQILDLIQAQRQDRNMSVILVTHDLGVVAGHTDEIIVMYAGQIVEQAPTPVLFSEMSMPYTEALLESIPKLDDPSHTRLRAIAGRPPDLINPPTGCRFAPAARTCRTGAVTEAATAGRGRDAGPHLRLLVPGRLRRLEGDQGPAGRGRRRRDPERRPRAWRRRGHARRRPDRRPPTGAEPGGSD